MSNDQLLKCSFGLMAIISFLSYVWDGQEKTFDAGAGLPPIAMALRDVEIAEPILLPTAEFEKQIIVANPCSTAMLFEMKKQSCACLSVTPNRITFDAGESKTITLRIRPRSRPGESHVMFDASFSNDKESFIEPIRISYSTLSRVDLGSIPEKIVVDRHTLDATPEVLKITTRASVTSRPADPIFEVNGVELPLSLVSSSVDVSTKTNQFRVESSDLIRALGNDFRGFVKFRLSHGEQSTTRTCVVAGRSDLTITPGSLTFVVSENRSRIRIVVESAKSMTIEDCRCSIAGVTCSWPKLVDSRAHVCVLSYFEEETGASISLGKKTGVVTVDSSNGDSAVVPIMLLRTTGRVSSAK